MLKVSLKNIIIIASIALNILLGAFYIKTTIADFFFNQGLSTGQNMIGNEIIKQINDTGKLSINTPEGELVLIPSANTDGE